MLFHQLLAVIIYSGWHYGRVYHNNQNGNTDLQQATGKVLLILFIVCKHNVIFCDNIQQVFI